MEQFHKEVYIKNCYAFNSCSKGIDRTCVGCNIWNMKHDMGALQDWCVKQGVKLFDVLEQLHKRLHDEK